ncbi:MAG: hypothetical protein JSV04_05460, partial [Candidatus Heimdallarchaeota archaeon]
INLIVRQGDLLLRKVEFLPKRAKIIEGDIVLEGEATGHAHRIVNGEIFRFWSRETGNQLFIKAHEGATLVHEEHSPIDLKSGVYEVRRQREYDPDTKSVRWIMD